MDSIFIPYHSMLYFLIWAEVMQHSIWNPWSDGGIHPFHMEYTGECKVLMLNTIWMLLVTISEDCHSGCYTQMWMFFELHFQSSDIHHVRHKSGCFFSIKSRLIVTWRESWTLPWTWSNPRITMRSRECLRRLRKNSGRARLNARRFPRGCYLLHPPQNLHLQN